VSRESERDRKTRRAIALLTTLLTVPGLAQEEGDLAKQTQKPVSDLISLQGAVSAFVGSLLCLVALRYARIIYRRKKAAQTGSAKPTQ
jgi:hypothetical protein